MSFPIQPSRVDPGDTRNTRAAIRDAIRCPPFDPDIAAEVLVTIASGVGVKDVALVPGLPAYAVINAWRIAHPEFNEACEAAGRAAAERMLWDTLSIADDKDRPPACRDTSIRARQFAMKVLDRKRFDPAVRVEHVGSTVDADAISDAELATLVLRKRAEGAQDVEAQGDTGGAPRESGRGGESVTPRHNPAPSKFDFQTLGDYE